MHIKKFLLYIICFLFTSSAFAVNVSEQQLRASQVKPLQAIETYLIATKSKDFLERYAQLEVLKFNNMLTMGNSAEQKKADLQADIDTANVECKLAGRGTKNFRCEYFDSLQKNYKDRYKETYTPKTPVTPKIDFKNYTYTLNGKSYDIKNLKEIKIAPKRADYVCEWDTSLAPRKLLNAPGCNGSSKICSGYVKCKTKGWTINRVATCASQFCSDSAATECAIQENYLSCDVTADGKAVSGTADVQRTQNGN